MALDSGLDREGARDLASAQRIAALLARSAHLDLTGFYTHEGQFYSSPNQERSAGITAMLDRLCTIRDAIDPSLPLWPGSSMTAAVIAAHHAPRVQALRPGTDVFGDLSLATSTGVMPFDNVALHVLATVVDKPTPDLALIDAGSKTSSSDRTAAGIGALAADGRDLAVVRVNEEHGYVRGTDVAGLRLGDRIRFVPAHVCTVVNLTDEVTLLDADDRILATWPVDARGCSR